VEGALFRRVWNRRAQRVGTQRLTARIVADIVKAASRLAFDPATFGAHSLRSGLVTTAVKRGVNLLKICRSATRPATRALKCCGCIAATPSFSSAMRPPGYCRERRLSAVIRGQADFHKEILL
jgi:hypothetical protein